MQIPWSSSDGSDCRISAIHVGDMDWAPGSQLGSCSPSCFVEIWNINQWIRAFSAFLTVTQINKTQKNEKNAPSVNFNASYLMGRVEWGIQVIQMYISHTVGLAGLHLCVMGEGQPYARVQFCTSPTKVPEYLLEQLQLRYVYCVTDSA